MILVLLVFHRKEPGLAAVPGEVALSSQVLLLLEFSISLPIIVEINSLEGFLLSLVCS